MNVRWSRKALGDLEDIHDFIRQDAPTKADEFINALIESAEQLELFPQSGRSVPEYDKPTIRELLHPPYRIIYRLKQDRVEIVTVIHNARILPME